MSTAVRPVDAGERSVDIVEALVERARAEGALSLEQLRAAFETAGIGPAEAGVVLRQLTAAGAVLGNEEGKRSRRPASARPAARSLRSRPPAPPAAPST